MLEQVNNKFLQDKITNEVSKGKYSIKRNLNSEIWELWYNIDGNNNIIIGTDNIDHFRSFYKDILNLEFNNILIGGLGLGIVPYLYQNTANHIDIIENDIDNIDLIRELNYIDTNKVSIINDNIFNYTPIKNYDLILLDIWSNYDISLISSETDILFEKYNSFLNPNGKIYFPILKWFNITSSLHI